MDRQIDETEEEGKRGEGVVVVEKQDSQTPAQALGARAVYVSFLYTYCALAKEPPPLQANKDD